MTRAESLKLYKEMITKKVVIMPGPQTEGDDIKTAWEKLQAVTLRLPSEETCYELAVFGFETALFWYGIANAAFDDIGTIQQRFLKYMQEHPK